MSTIAFPIQVLMLIGTTNCGGMIGAGEVESEGNFLDFTCHFGIVAAVTALLVG